MSFMNAETPVIALPELDLFENIPVQNSIEDTLVERIYPVSHLNSGGHIEFIVNTHENEFIRPVDALIQIQYHVKLTKTGSSSTITDDDWKRISMVNNAADSMFGQIDVSIGESQLTKPIWTHPYKAYIHTVLHAPEEAKKTFLKLRGFTDDDMSESKRHKPQESRQARFKPLSTAVDKSKGKKDEFWMPLHVDIFRQMKDLIGGITLKIRLIPNRPEFFFMVDSDFLYPSIHFERVVLHLPKRAVSGSVTMGLLKALSITPARYPRERAEVRTHVIDSGTTSRNLDNVYDGTAPRTALLMFVNNEASSGSFKKNPYFFHHYDVTSVSCFLNSVLINRRPYEPDHDLEYMGDEYLNLLKVVGQLNNNITTTITPEQFKNGFFMIPFDLTRDNSQGYFKSGYADPPLTNSTLRFSIKFKTSLPETITCLVYMEWDDMILVDSLKNATVLGD